MATYEVLASILTTKTSRYRKGDLVELTGPEEERALRFGAVRVPGSEPEPDADPADDASEDGDDDDTHDDTSEDPSEDGDDQGEGAGDEDDGDAGTPEATTGDKPPAQSEPKAAFVDYAVDVLSIDRQDAEAMSKADLVELVRK